MTQLKKHVKNELIKKADEILTTESKSQYKRLIESCINEKTDTISKWACYYSNKENMQKKLTARQYEKLQNKQLSMVDVKKIIIEKTIKQETKEFFTPTLESINRAASARPLEFGIINVEWNHNRTWGMNPTAEININGVIYSANASGCGYDKLSAAIASALNKSATAQKYLYDLEEKRLTTQKAKRKTRRDFIGYGSGYSALPYYEGGCGVTCFYDIFKAGGFDFKQTGEGKTFDCFSILKSI